MHSFFLFIQESLGRQPDCIIINRFVIQPFNYREEMGDMTSVCCHQPLNQKAITRQELVTLDGHEAFDHSIKEFINRFPKIKQIYDKKFSYCSNIDKRTIVIRGSDVFVGKLQEIDTRREGMVMYNNGFFYEGDIVSYMRDGLGRLISAQGDCYQGKWVKNQASGEGTYESNHPKRKYIGVWHSQELQGKGKAIYQDGSHYQGEFHKNLRHGRGKIAYIDGTFYQGHFRNNIIQGFGTLIGLNHKYQGNWKNGKMQGAGKSYWYNQQNQLLQTYEGQYVDGLKHGKGEYRWQNGRVFKGQWEYGEIRSPSNIEK